MANRNDFWFPPGKGAQIGWHFVPDGMIHVGAGLRAMSGGSVEPALIDPRLAIGEPTAGSVQIGYWPSYDRLTPDCRATYLNWLATGRSDPGIDIGYVFLFFYGLERRLLVDLKPSNSPTSEWQYLLAELRRLLAIYGSSGSFHGYASSLIDFCVALSQPVADNLPQPPRERVGYDLPVSLKYALGTLSAQAKPIPWEWAFSWYVCHPQTSLRTPAKRCSKEFRALFGWRYVAALGHGLVIEPNKTTLAVEHRPASASFMGRSFVAKTAVPDVTVLKRPFATVSKLGEQCELDLEPFSRWLGRNPERRGDLEAVALLPDELARGHRGSAVAEMRQWAEERLQNQPRIALQADDLLQWTPSPAADKLSKKEAVLFAQLLGKLGYGLEPDVRFGGPCLKKGDMATIFRLPQDAASAASDEYLAATLLTDLFVAVAAADGQLGKEEYDLLVSHMRDQMDLSAKEATRLNAHIWWLYHAKPSIKGIQKLFAGVGADQTSALCQFLTQVACADGVVSPDEVSVLVRVYEMLGLDQGQVHRDIHSCISGISAPSADPDSAAGDRARRDAPKSSLGTEATGSRRQLDMSLIQRKIAETAKIADVLTGIFEEEDEAVVPGAGEQAAVSVGGLDQAHALLLHDLQEHNSLARGQFDEMAARRSLLPDGALDALNEAALDACDEMVCEVCGDVIQVNTDILKEMLATS